MFVMSLSSVVVDRLSFKMTSEMTKGQEFRLPIANFEIDHSARNECKVLCSFIFMYGAGSPFASRPFTFMVHSAA